MNNIKEESVYAVIARAIINGEEVKYEDFKSDWIVGKKAESKFNRFVKFLVEANENLLACDKDFDKAYNVEEKYIKRAPVQILTENSEVFSGSLAEISSMDAQFLHSMEMFSISEDNSIECKISLAVFGWLISQNVTRGRQEKNYLLFFFAYTCILKLKDILSKEQEKKIA